MRRISIKKPVFIVFFSIMVGINFSMAADQKIPLLHGPLFFNVDKEYQSDLDKGQIPEIMKEEFEKLNIQFSQKTRVLTKTPNNKWIIVDRGIDQTYTVVKENDKLNVYARLQNYGDPSTLKLEISAVKQVVSYEPIFFTVKMTNTSKDEILDVMLPIQVIGRCDVFDPSGKKMPLSSRLSGMMVGGSSRLLEPGEIICKTFNLLDYFDIGKQAVRYTSDIGKREGKYTIKYSCPLLKLETNDKNQTYPVNNGSLISKLNIEVTAPSGNIEKEALNIFQPAILRQLRGEDDNIIAENYKRILKEYPNSKYAESALFHLAQYYDDAWMIDEADKTYEEFIKKYPKSFFTDIAKFNQKEARERAIREPETLLQMKKAREERSNIKVKPESQK